MVAAENLLAWFFGYDCNSISEKKRQSNSDILYELNCCWESAFIFPEICNSFSFPFCKQVFPIALQTLANDNSHLNEGRCINLRFDQCVVTPKERIKAIDAWKQPSSSTSFKVVNSPQT